MNDTMTSEFLFTDSFLSETKKKFDTILIESTFSESETNFLGAVAHHTRQPQKLLIVVSQTSVDILFPLIQTGKAITTIINPSCGMTGFANKGFWDMRDIAKARDFGLQVFEPMYQEQLLDFLQGKTSCYIRINEHTPRKDQLPEGEETSEIISFQHHGYAGSNGTILGFGSLIIDTLYGAGYLQEEGHAMDVFATTTPFFTLQEQLKESIQRTEKLIIILDQHRGSLYEYWIKLLLSDAGLSGVTIEFITPSYQKVSSLALEYMYEQAEIDGFHLVKRIKN